MKKQSFELTKVAILTSLVFLIAGCGAAEKQLPVAAVPAPVSPGVAPPVGGTSCAAGQTKIGDGPCLVGDFRTVCTHWLTGGFVTTIEGRETCKVSRTWSSVSLGGSGYGFPLVTQSLPGGSASSNTGINVRVNDQVTIDNVSGAWGGASQEAYEFLGFIPTTIWKMDCKQVSVDGLKDGSEVSYEGKAAGVFGSDGTNVFVVGKGITNQRIAAHGTLKIGFNAPDPYNSCGTVSFRVKLAHCEDASGNSYLCP
ncbi:MAG: hypothetical protein A2X94_14295 [Bdellovibrionales bacterium GWB1_55_8]|nr:MAG: hypothetical protein A2X94_14295 [Bdellovibrionales bacterium GWB1_55_8]